MACADLCLEARSTQVLEQTPELFGSCVIVYGVVSLEQYIYVPIFDLVNKEKYGNLG